MRPFVRTFGLILLILMGAVLVVGSGGGGGSRGSNITPSSLTPITEVNGVPFTNAAWEILSAAFELTLPVLEQDLVNLTCDNAPNGSVHVTATGTTVDLQFDNCSLVSSGVTLNGDVTLDSIVPDPDPLDRTLSTWSLSAQVTFDQFTMNDGTRTVTANGTVTGTTSTSSAGVAVTTTLTGSSLDLHVGAMNATILDFTLTETDDHNVGIYSYVANGRLSSTVFDGVVAFETVTTITGTVGQLPYVGDLMISGGINSNATLIIMDGKNIAIRVIDDNGILFTTTTTWPAFTGG